MDDEGRIEPTIIRSVAMNAAGDLLLLIGVVFVLLGIANFLTDYLKVKGAGEFLVGIALVLIAVILIMRSRIPIPIEKHPVEEKKKSEDYR